MAIIKSQKNIMPQLQQDVQAFLARKPLEKSSLVLDGTGVNGGIQYAVLNSLGWERLTKLSAIHVVSGSTFSWIYYWALHQGLTKVPENHGEQWDREMRGLHQRIPILGLLEPLINNVLNRRSSRPSRLLSDMLHLLLNEDGCGTTVEALPPNVVFWTYEKGTKKLVEISPSSPLKTKRLDELVQITCRAPFLYQAYTDEHGSYTDPVYSPQHSQLRKILSASSENVLFSNVIKQKSTPSIIFTKPHGYKNGRLLLARDFALFQAGLPNPWVRDSIDNGLIHTENC